MVNRLAAAEHECNGSPAPSPAFNRAPDCEKTRAIIRRHILADSAMNQDALKIKKTAEKLLEMLRDFWNDHDSGVGGTLWLQSGGVTFDEFCDNKPLMRQGYSWSERLCSDAAGFAWALDAFVRQFSTCVLPRKVSEKVMQEMLTRLDDATLGEPGDE
ncbi:unnamed protein product [Gemmataceae bacterium]|nr:unnamed protein product [Gemmataceae bacterium]VTT97947.1 unnamed protein product [Gemmataceae bacterium]